MIHEFDLVHRKWRADDINDDDGESVRTLLVVNDDCTLIAIVYDDRDVVAVRFMHSALLRDLRIVCRRVVGASFPFQSCGGGLSDPIGVTVFFRWLSLLWSSRDRWFLGDLGGFGVGGKCPGGWSC